MLAAPDAIDVVLRDGATARLRQASIDDREQLHQFYGHLSAQSRYFRFFGKPHVDDIVGDVVRALASRDAVTLVAEVDHRIVAVAQYFPTKAAGRAEAAFAIADAHQGRGIGTKLLERLGVVARSRGIHFVSACPSSVRATSRQSLRIRRQFGGNAAGPGLFARPRAATGGQWCSDDVRP